LCLVLYNYTIVNTPARKSRFLVWSRCFARNMCAICMPHINTFPIFCICIAKSLFFAPPYTVEYSIFSANKENYKRKLCLKITTTIEVYLILIFRTHFCTKMFFYLKMSYISLKKIFFKVFFNVFTFRIHLSISQFPHSYKFPRKSPFSPNDI
jgi:hypothetical protein